MKRCAWSLLGGALLCSTAVLAQPKRALRQIAAAPAAPKTQNRTAGEVLINAPNGGVWQDDQQVGHLTKNVTVSQEGEDFILYCDDLTYNKRTNVGIARVNLKVESSDSTITGNAIHADFNAKLITIRGHVVMNSHGSEDGIRGSAPNKANKRRRLPAQLEGKASTMTCDLIVYNYETHQAEITGNIHMQQADSSGTCERIIFDDRANIARLLGNAQFGNAEKRTFKSPEITVWIDTNVIQTKAGTITSPSNADENTRPRQKPTDFGPPPPLDIPPDIQNELNQGTEATPPGGGPTGATPPPAGGDKNTAPSKPPSSTRVEDKSGTDSTTQPKPTKTAERSGKAEG